MNNNPAFPSAIFPALPLGNPATPPPARVVWMRERPLAFIGAWEPLSFRQRAGYAFTDEAEFMHEHEFSDAAFDRYAKLGANLIVLPFAKGFGLKNTPHEIADEKVWARRAHEHGLRVGAYIRADALVPETVALEHPEVGEWLSVGMYDRHSRYGEQQTFRKRLCYSHPDAVNYLQDVMQAAIGEIGADLLHFDGFRIVNLPWETCRCNFCLTSYRQWLKWRYADDELRERVFGVVNFDTIEMPEFEPHKRLPPVISSADIQAWYQFQWDRTSTFTRHLRRFAQDLNPNVAISINPGWGCQTSSARWLGFQAETLLPWVDSIWTEDLAHLQFTDNHVVSRISTFKTAREYSLPLSHYHWHREEAEIEASLALSLASNGGNPSCLGFSFRYLPHFSLAEETKRRYTQWAREQWQLLSDTTPAGEIALLRHATSSAWNGDQPWVSAIAMEQLLIDLGVPWRIFDTLDEAHLQQITTLLLPDVECLSDEEVVLLKRWAKNGGRLFITGRTGTHDEYRRRRPCSAFLQKTATPYDWHNWVFADFMPDMVDGEQNTLAEGKQSTSTEGKIIPLGKGFLGYWPVLLPPRPNMDCWLIEAADRRPPANAEHLIPFLQKLHGSFDYEVHGDASILSDTAVQPLTGEYLLHVIRTDPKPGTSDVTIMRRTAWPEFRVLSPDLEQPQVKIDKNTLQLLNLQRYAVVVINNDDNTKN